MAEPSQERAAQTLEIIATAAKRILREEGFAALRTNRLAQVAGVSIGTVYRYFRDIDAVMNHLIDVYNQRVAHELQAAAAEALSKPFAEGVRLFLAANLRVHVAEPEIYRMLLGETQRIRANATMLANLRRSQEMVRASFSAFASELRACDLDLAAMIITHAVEATTHFAVADFPAYAESPAFLDELTLLVVRYLTDDGGPSTGPHET